MVWNLDRAGVWFFFFFLPFHLPTFELVGSTLPPHTCPRHCLKVHVGRFLFSICGSSIAVACNVSVLWEVCCICVVYWGSIQKGKQRGMLAIAQAMLFQLCWRDSAFGLEMGHL